MQMTAAEFWNHFSAFEFCASEDVDSEPLCDVVTGTAVQLLDVPKHSGDRVFGLFWRNRVS